MIPKRLYPHESTEPLHEVFRCIRGVSGERVKVNERALCADAPQGGKGGWEKKTKNRADAACGCAVRGTCDCVHVKRQRDVRCANILTRPSE